MLPLNREIADARPTYAYPRITVLLNKQLAELEHPQVNKDRLYQILAVNNLLLPKYKGRFTRVYNGKATTLTSNARWCSDVFTIPCWNRELFWVAFSLECCDQEVMSFIVTNVGISEEMVRDLMAETIESSFRTVDRLPHRIKWLSGNSST